MRATASNSLISVKVGRFNEPTHDVEVNEGSTISVVLNKLSITVSDTETLWVDGEKAELHFEVENNDRIIIVGKKEGGIDPEEEVDVEEVPTPEVE